ncbi:DNA repair protein Rev1p [[Candida] railenensis]|uniref:DNA repair protein REV1 n=1 Tax=[Candida] railenensis TaxID=45579 RepID=A0A9P0QSN8_9ASCO|nr:DNA repair protein Rev1p [[Candida] railenensis]
MSRSLMEAIDEEDLSEFTSSIRSMDDQTFSQFVQNSVAIASTPKNENNGRQISEESIRSSVSHDPFDDGLDNVLMNIRVAEGHPSENAIGDKDSVIDSIVNCAQEVPVDTDDDDEDAKSTSETEERDEENKIEGEMSQTSSAEIVIGKPHGFGDYATYFGNKAAKQQKADHEYILWEKKRRQGKESVPQILKGCIIHVNGHTVPSINEIHRLVILYGGKFISYLNNKGAATHIICDRLTPRKRIQFKNYRVVKAQWLVDSIEKGEMLKWEDYRLIDNVEYGQQRLTLQRENQVETRDEGSASSDRNAFLKDSTLAQSDQKLNLASEKEVVKGDEIEGDFNVFPSHQEEGIADGNEIDGVLDILPSIQSQQEEEEEANLTQSGELHLESMNQDEPVMKRGIAMDAKHPDFLKNFFAYSRLHHLSSWKADLRAHFLKKILEAPSQEKPRRKHSEKVIMHADFDCFFATASALGRKDIDFETVPLAVSHGGKTSDVASCNYVARRYGVKNGMWISEAKKLCPTLVTLKYDFDLYEKFSGMLYDYLIELNIFDSIFPVSIDEVLLDLTSYVEDQQKEGKNKAEIVGDLATNMRKKIHELTECSISIGTSKNVLLAKLCLRRAKPDGQFYLEDGIDEFLKDIPVRDLPGIGRSLVEKLKDEIIRTTDSSFTSTPTISHLRQIDETRMKVLFGEKTGPKLWQYSRGIDNTNIDIRENKDSLKRKSVSVDVNYGIRFDHISQVDNFLMELSKELYRRLMHLTMCGSSVTLRLARRAVTAPIDPPKYLGMGYCNFLNKSSKLGVPTNDWGLIGSELKSLYRMLNVPVYDLRGVSVTLTNLVDIEELKKNRQRQLPFKPPVTMIIPSAETKVAEVGTSTEKLVIEPIIDPLEVDLDVLEALPSSIRAEIQEEINRRGMKILKSDSKLSDSPAPFSRDISPQKLHSPTKSYMQQLLPSSLGKPEYTRVFESPKKLSPSKRIRNQISSSPTKKPKPNKNRRSSEDSSLYDESVINELPSSVRKEVLKDLEIKLKSKKKKKSLEKFILTSNWIIDQKKCLILPSPTFQNKFMSLKELQQLLSDWIESSLVQGGPHVDDVNLILDYFEELLQQDNLLRCMNLLRHVKVVVECKSIIFSNVERTEGEDSQLIKEGLDEWAKIIESSLRPMIQRYCIQNVIEVEYDFI